MENNKSRIILSDELICLTEAMAQNVHTAWMNRRLKEGWSYGNQRNDLLKQHPCIVPYDTLPESEKEFDRQTAIETLKFIIEAGFNITKK